MAVLPDQMHQALRAAWQHIDNPTTTLTDQQCRERFLAYQPYYTNTHWPDTPIQLQHVEDALKRAKPAASPGKSSWSIADLRSLPRIAKVELTQVMRIWDIHGPPEDLNEVYVTMIPKDLDNPDPMALRPIAVEPLLIRLWTTIKVRMWAPYITAAIPTTQHGGVPGRSVYQLVAELAVDVELHRLLDRNLSGISFDFAKFFDSLPQGLIERVLVASGAPAPWARMYQSFVQQQRYRYRFPNKACGPAFQKQCGVPQGDAFSVVTALLMVVGLTQQLEEIQAPAAHTRMYMDDLTYRTTTWASLDEADTTVRRCGQTWGITISPKTTSFTTAKQDQQHDVHRLGYLPSAEVKWLGTYHIFQPSTRPLATAALQKKITTAKQRLRRIHWLEAPWDLRQHYIATSALSGLCWCPLGQVYDPAPLKALDHMVLQHMFGGNPAALQKIARELFWTTLVKGHKLSSLVARVFSTIVALRHMRPEGCTNLRHIMQRVAEGAPPVKGGLLVTFRAMCADIGLQFTDEMELQNDEGDTLHILAELPSKEFLHRLRSLWRASQLSRLERRRPHFQELRQRGINAPLLRQWLSRLEKQPVQATLARLVWCDAYRTAAWMSTHTTTAGQPRFQATCPNCRQADETTHHLLWECPAWAPLRLLAFATVEDLPPFSLRTWLPTVDLTKEQVERMRQAFFQTVTILERHMREGRECLEYVRRRVTGKQPAQGGRRQAPQPEVDLGLGGHTLELRDVQGRRSFVCTACNMRSTFGNRSWFAQHPCGRWVTRRRDTVECPLGLRDLTCSATGDRYCVCLWCGAFDRQRSNIIRRHACWNTLLKQAILEHRDSLAQHMPCMMGVLGGLGDQVDHDIRQCNGQRICIQCGRIGRTLRFHKKCFPFLFSAYGLTADSYQEMLRASQHLFE